MEGRREVIDQPRLKAISTLMTSDKGRLLANLLGRTDFLKGTLAFNDINTIVSHEVG